jgi:hypothetical protein
VYIYINTTLHQAFEDGPDRGFRNVGQYKLDAVEKSKVDTLNTEHGESLKSRTREKYLMRTT